MQETNTYEVDLFNFIKENHAEMLLDKDQVKEFIKDRAIDASEAYEKAMQAGHRNLEAMEIANQVLYRNLEFCPLDLIENIAEETKKEVTQEELIQCYILTKNIIGKHPKEKLENDESAEYLALKKELTIFIAENGIF